MLKAAFGVDGIPITGLEPRAWLVVDAGINREDVKAYFLERGLGFTADAILDLGGFCRKILGPLVEDARVLAPSGRQEVLRKILRDSSRLELMPEIRRLKRQRGFFRKLDRSVQDARMTFASLGEREAQEERIQSLGLRGSVRMEVGLLTNYYELWLQENRAWDLPRMLLGATGVLRSDEIDLAALGVPAEVFVLSATRGESRTEAFFEALAARVEMRRAVLAETGAEAAPTEEGAREARTGDGASAEWHEWHTLDDAVEALADSLHAAALAGELEEHGVLIPDQPGVRRTLNRALAERGILYEDPRDPTRLRLDESIKHALLPLEMVARNYPRDLVLAYLHSPFCGLEAPLPERLQQEIEDQGIRAGLGAYASAKLQPLRDEFAALEHAVPPRAKVLEARDVHLGFLDRLAGLERESHWLRAFFEEQWNRFEADLRVVGEANRRAPLLYWIDRMKLRVEEATPPVERTKYRGGLKLFRLGQWPLRYPKRLWALALPARYTSDEETGDYFLSSRERELLSGSFQVRSSIQEAQDRKRELERWLAGAERATFLDAAYDWDGREQEGIEPLVRELGLGLVKDERGSHPRWKDSYRAPTAHPPREIRLRPYPREEATASALESASRCEFQGLALGRWKLREYREADLDLRPDARGILLHEAVRILTESRGAAGFSVSPEEALARAWAEKRPKGLFRSPRLERVSRQKLLPILAAFCEQELKYAAQSRTTVQSLEGPELHYASHGIRFKGIPDRIDSHRDGLILIDYKSSEGPTAEQMLGKGYRLQLPLYALAAQDQLERPVIGVQFVTLSKKGPRARGIIPKAWHGKEEGKISNTRSKASVVAKEPNEIWAEAAEQVEAHIARFQSGEVHVRPKEWKEGAPYHECEHCRVRDVCGQRRFPLLGEDAEEGGGE